MVKVDALTSRIRLTGVGILDVVSYDPHVHISGLQVCLAEPRSQYPQIIAKQTLTLAARRSSVPRKTNNDSLLRMVRTRPTPRRTPRPHLSTLFSRRQESSHVPMWETTWTRWEEYRRGD